MEQYGIQFFILPRCVLVYSVNYIYSVFWENQISGSELDAFYIFVCVFGDFLEGVGILGGGGIPGNRWN